ncbi:hypothetical protein [uncultured Capnocytophaga sp.]|uniref:LPD3 domain-containing protein n=1 Tax=uncultured Capnocytophaga sp. TaxID=159273 RepID=UPI0028E3EEE7|nr:hypothetical protein [uncultured Capnocytophaga sp.]
MTVIEAFNSLDNREVSRKEVEQVLLQAKAENNTTIIYRLSKILNDYPQATHFEISVTHYQPQEGLLGVQHTGNYKEALDDCGRLRKGWKFVNGNVVKVEKKEKLKKESKPKKETDKTAIDDIRKIVQERLKNQGKPRLYEVLHLESAKGIFIFSWSDLGNIDGTKKKENSLAKGLYQYTFPKFKNTQEKIKFSNQVWYDLLINKSLTLKRKIEEPTLNIINLYLGKNTIEEIESISKKTTKEAKPKKEAQPKKEKAPQKETKKDKKYNFVVVTDNRPNRVIAVFSYTNPNIKDLRESFWKNGEGKYYETTEEGLRNYTFGMGPYPFADAKKHIEEKYTEGKDFIYFIFEKDGGRDEAISLVEKPKKEKSKAEEKTPAKKELPRDFSEDLDYKSLYNSYSLISFDPERRAENDKKMFGTSMLNLYNSSAEEAKENNRLEEYNQAFERYYAVILKKNKEVISARTGTFSTAVTGGAGIKSSQIRKNEAKQKREYEINKELIDYIEKAEKKLNEVARNPDQFYKDQAIKRTDKNAIEKLNQKLEQLEAEKDFIKRSEKACKEYQKTKDFSVFEKYNIPQKEAKEYVSQIERHGIPLIRGNASINAEIRRVKERIASLEKSKATEDENFDIENGRILVNKEAQRVQIFFDNIPDANTREALKKRSFKWAPSVKAWQRTLTGNAIDAVRYLIKDGVLVKKNSEEVVMSVKSKEEKVENETINIDSSQFKKAKVVQQIGDYVKNFFETGNCYVPKGIFPKKREGFKSINLKGAFWLDDLEKEGLAQVKKNGEIFFVKTGLNAPFPEVSTERFKKMKVSELRAFTLRYYNLFLKGDSETIERHLKEVVFTNKAGRKIALGEAMYSAKAAVIAHLKTLIKNSTYNNWGDRKGSDGKDVLGYLNFKSKLTIDGEKRHVRISLVVYRDRKTELKNVEVGKKKSRVPQGALPSVEGTQLFKAVQSTQDPVGTLQDGRIEQLSDGKDTKKSLSRKKKDENFGLNAPEAPEISLPATRQTLAQQLATRPEVRESFLVADEQMSLFLGSLEKKTKDSLVITLTGKQGSGKTRFAFQFMNALAQRYRVGHASIEEHPESVLYEEKAYQYLNDTALEHITAQDVRSLEELDTMIRTNEVIVIDSFQKMRELAPNFEIDKDLRKKYDGKLFLVIFQQTADGKMRGGSKSQYDGDIILFTETFPDYRENYVFPDKNRYNKRPATELQYSIYEKRMLASAPEDSSLPDPQEPTEIDELNFDVL